MTKEAVMEEALKNTCDGTPLICTNLMRTSGRILYGEWSICLSKSDKVMGVRLSKIQKNMGAISEFYPGVLQRLAQLMGSDLYIYLQVGMKVQFTVK